MSTDAQRLAEQAAQALAKEGLMKVLPELKSKPRILTAEEIQHLETLLNRKQFGGRQTPIGNDNIPAAAVGQDMALGVVENVTP